MKLKKIIITTTTAPRAPANVKEGFFGTAIGCCCCCCDCCCCCC